MFAVGERCWAVVSVCIMQKEVCLQEYIKMKLSDIAGGAGLSHNVTHRCTLLMQVQCTIEISKHVMMCHAQLRPMQTDSAKVAGSQLEMLFIAMKGSLASNPAEEAMQCKKHCLACSKI